jgi:glycerate dehydrogenase
MKIYLIVSETNMAPHDQLLASLEEVAPVQIIIHNGKLRDVTELQTDRENDKVLGLDPSSFSWELEMNEIDTISKVKSICTSSTGFEWLDPHELKKRSIVACNAPGFSTDAVAEYAVCMAIETARCLPIYIKNNWSTEKVQISPFLLKGKTVGIVGLGRIGKRIAEICQGIGMNVRYWSREKKDNRFEHQPLERIFSESDVVIPALPYNDKTKELITLELLQRIPGHTILVAVGGMRELWNEKYILERVGKGTLGGYAFEKEEDESINNFKGNVLAFPTIAWNTKESHDELMRIWSNTIMAAVMGKPINVVNA